MKSTLSRSDRERGAACLARVRAGLRPKAVEGLSDDLAFLESLVPLPALGGAGAAISATFRDKRDREEFLVTYPDLGDDRVAVIVGWSDLERFTGLTPTSLRVQLSNGKGSIYRGRGETRALVTRTGVLLPAGARSTPGRDWPRGTAPSFLPF